MMLMTLSLLFLLTALAHSPSVAPFSPRWGAAASTGASAAWQAKAGAVLAHSSHHEREAAHRLTWSLHPRPGGFVRPTWCPASAVEHIDAAGLLSVKLFGAVGDGLHDDAPAVRTALNVSAGCGGCVFFPPGDYFLNSTVATGGAGCMKGSRNWGGNAPVDGSSQPATTILGPPTGHGPALVVNGWTTVEDLAIVGKDTGVLIPPGSAIVRMINVGMAATQNADNVTTTAPSCNETGCNVRLGSHNAALVVESSYWLWFERCSFLAMSIGSPCINGTEGKRNAHCGYGQRPSVILRGGNHSVGTTYLVRFDRSIFTGGGVQYQQTMDNPGGPPGSPYVEQGAPAGWFDFVSCCLEDSGTPLLDLQSEPSLKADVQGLEQVAISHYMNADGPRANFGARGGCDGYLGEVNATSCPPVVSINCTQSGCGIDGLSISMSGDSTPVAVRVYAGFVRGAIISGATVGAYQAHGVLDASGRVTGT